MATVLALVVVNVASNRLVPHAWYVPFAVASSAGLLAIARWVDHLSWEALGLDRRDAPRGARWGAVLAASVLAIYLVGFALPATHDLFLDERAQHLSLGGALLAAFVRVPLGTVLLEEVAFRSVLPAALALRLRVWQAAGLAALAFGLWHVLPSLGLQHVNPVADDTVGRLPEWVTVAGSVGSTALVGLWFFWLRWRSRSLLAPMVLHWSTNALAYLFAWWAWNR